VIEDPLVRLRAWIAGFRWLHEKARREPLTAEEAEAYREAREDMAAMLLAAQRLTLAPGEIARDALRVVRQLPVWLQLITGKMRAEALDISTGGFSALLDRPFPPAETITFSLLLGDGPLSGRARVASSHEQGKSYRISFRFEDLSPADAERMGSEVLDAALEHLAAIVEHT
jgi:hypothetical protein